jgi:hypothetical protein
MLISPFNPYARQVGRGPAGLYPAGPAGESHRAGPVGYRPPLPLDAQLADRRKGGVAAKPANHPAVKTVKLSFVGKFKNPWSSPKAEAEAMLAGRWEPSVDDFSALALAQTGDDGKTMTVDSILNLLGAIALEPDGSVTEVNIFTHANRGFIAFGGTIKPGPSSSLVELNAAGAMDEDFLNNLPDIPYFEATLGTKKKRFTLADVQRKFVKDAHINVFACHSGQDPAFLKLLAATFQVKVIGFTQVVRYDVQVDANGRFNRAAENVGLGFRKADGSISFRGAAPVKNFHELLDKGFTAAP